MGTPVIVEAVRTPIARRGKALAGLHPAEILAHAQLSVIERAGIDPKLVEQVVGGCVSQAGPQAANVARNAWLWAGLPQETAARVEPAAVRLQPDQEPSASLPNGAQEARR